MPSSFIKSFIFFFLISFPLKSSFALPFLSYSSPIFFQSIIIPLNILFLFLLYSYHSIVFTTLTPKSLNQLTPFYSFIGHCFFFLLPEHFTAFLKICNHISIPRFLRHSICFSIYFRFKILPSRKFQRMVMI